MAGLADWRPVALEPALEKRYAAQQLERVVVLGRLGSVIGGLSFLGYGAWDLLLDPQAWSRTGPIRLAVFAFFVLAHAATYWRPFRTSAVNWLAVNVVIYLMVAVGFALVLAELPGGFVAGTPGFIMGMIFLPVLVTSFAQSVVILLPYVAAAGLVMSLSGASSFELVNAAAWTGGGIAFALGFAYLLDIINRRAYLIERALEHEKQRSEALLLNILPAPVAERLKASQAVIADDCLSATVLFADLVGFTDLARRLAAGQVVALLNDLFSRFDRLAERHGVEKIKTIGDAYMAAAGVPAARPDHAEAAARLALDMREAFEAFRRQHGLRLRLRIGMHSGGLVAGVIGARKFAYDLWGDTVNVASRMESEGLPGEIQISAETRALLSDAWRAEARGPIALKGHAAKQAFLLKELRAD